MSDIESENKLDKLIEVETRLQTLELEILITKTTQILEGLLKFSTDGVLAVSAKGQILVCNTALEQMFGYALHELVNQPVEMLLPTGLREQHVKHRIAFAMEARSRPMGQGITMGLRGLRKNGSTFPIGISINPLRIDETQIFCLVVTSLGNGG